MVIGFTFNECRHIANASTLAPILKTNTLRRQLFNWTIFLALTFEFTACNGQVKTNLPFESGSDSKRIANGHPKLIKTQGTSEYANIHCGLQDKGGNLWFGTTGEGVYRYDGKFFTQFTVKDGLSNNTVWSIAEDKNGNIWFGTDDGICRYDGKTFSRIPISMSNSNNFYLNKSLNAPSAKNDVWSIMQDKSGILWFGTRDGLYCYDGKSFSRFLENKSIVNKDNLHLKMIDCMLEDKKGNIWFASGMGSGGEGICRYNPASHEITSHKPYGNGWIRTIIEATDGNIYIATRHNGVCYYDSSSGGFINFTEKAGINNSSVTTISEDKAGNIWVGTELGSGQLGEDGGVWRFDGKSFTKFTTKEGLIHNGVFTILEDKSGNIWFGTRNIGLCRYDGKTFSSFSE